MKYLIFKDKKRRALFKKTELNFLIFRAFLRENFIKNSIWKKNFNNGILPNFVSFYKNSELFFFHDNNVNNQLKIRNRCVVTGRARSINRRYKVSRIVLRELASKGVIVGLTKKSW